MRMTPVQWREEFSGLALVPVRTFATRVVLSVMVVVGGTCALAALRCHPAALFYAVVSAGLAAHCVLRESSTRAVAAALLGVAYGALVAAPAVMADFYGWPPSSEAALLLLSIGGIPGAVLASVLASFLDRPLRGFWAWRVIRAVIVALVVALWGAWAAHLDLAHLDMQRDFINYL